MATDTLNIRVLGSQECLEVQAGTGRVYVVRPLHHRVYYFLVERVAVEQVKSKDEVSATKVMDTWPYIRERRQSLPRGYKRHRFGVVPQYGSFHTYWAQKFLNVKFKCWTVTVKAGKGVEKIRAEEANQVLAALFRHQGATQGTATYWLGNIGAVEITLKDVPDSESVSGRQTILSLQAGGETRAAQAQTASVQSALGDDRLYECLERLYPKYPLLEWYGEKRPVTVFPASPDEWGNLEASLLALRELDARRGESDRARYGTEYTRLGLAKYDELVARNLAAPEEVWNGRTYTMTRFQVGGSPRFQCGLGRYFDAVATCDVMEKELFDTVQRQSSGQVTARCIELADLPIRKWLHDRVADPVVDGSFRSAAIACSTLILYRATSGRYCMIVSQRSAKVAAHPFQYHVAPSFMLGPVQDPLLEFSIEHNMKREYLEELYRLPEVRSSDKDPSPPMDPRFFYGKRPLQRLNEMLTQTNPDKKAYLLYTGITISLLNLRPEVCLLLIVNDKEWYPSESGQQPSGNSADILHFNEEFLTPEEERLAPMVLKGHPRSLVLRELDDHLEPENEKYFSRANLVPPANAAIALGLDVARKFLKIE